jgi:iron complex transport system ATP-binding protein
MPEPDNRQPAIALRGVGLLRQDRWIVRDIDWTVAAGSCAAIIGPNGSGKSTLTRIMAGHTWPSHGSVSVLGETFGEVDLAQLRRRVHLVQAAGPYDVDPQLTARQAVITGFFGTLGLYETPAQPMLDAAERLLRQVGLSRVADHAYQTLSSGERVRCLIARALAGEPQLLLLDEPTAGLDLLAREQVLATVQHMFQPPHRDPPAVVLITHHIEELPPATSNVILLAEGRVAGSGRPRDVLRSDRLSGVYGCPMTVERQDGRYFVRVSPTAWDGLIDRS